MLDKMRDMVSDVEENIITVKEVMVTFSFTDKDLEDPETKALYEMLIASNTAVSQEVALDIKAEGS